MSITPNDVLNKNKSLNKRVDVENINVSDVSIDDLKFNGKNYYNYINLISLLENISTCQVSDAYNGAFKRSGVISKLKPVNNKKVWGRIFTAETDSDDWGTSAQAIDSAESGDILFIKVSDDEKAIWGELASTCAKNNGIKGVAIYGSARDMDALLYIDFPVFACNFRPNAGSPIGLGKLASTITVEDIEIKTGDFFIGDESGVVVIPQKLFNKVINDSLVIKLKESQIVDSLNDGRTLSQIVGLD